jgi:uncharacterized protein YbjT (DUF2867 family)
MTQATKTILLAGSNGGVGSLVLQALLAKQDVQVRVLNRRPASAAAPVEVHHGDVADPAVADAAVKGVGAIISTLNGGPDVMIKGQMALLEAAKRHGVRRFIPSDYSGYFFGLDYGDNVFLDMHKRFAETLQTSSVGYSIVLSGGFIEVALGKTGVFNFKEGTAAFWGTGSEQVDLTSKPDVAKLVAEVVFDDRAHNQVVQYAGESTSYRGIAKDFEALTGRSMQMSSRGDVADLERWIAERKAAARSPMEYVFAQYQYGSVSGKTALPGPLWNDRYPDLRPKSVKDILASVLAPV